MTSSSTTHCPTCAAPIREESSKFCAFCGTKLPEPEKVVVQAWAPNTRERFEAAARHPKTDELLKRTPSAAGQTAFYWMVATIAGVTAGSALFLIGAGLTVSDQSSIPLLLGVPMLLVGGLLCAGFTLKAKRFGAAPIERCIALVVDEDKRPRPGGDGRTVAHYLLLEQGSGERTEFEVPAETAATVARTDMGVLYTKRGVFVDFQRIPLR